MCYSTEFADEMDKSEYSFDDDSSIGKSGPLSISFKDVETTTPRDSIEIKLPKLKSPRRQLSRGYSFSRKIKQT